MVLGVPHSNDVDDIYNGYHIPKNSTVIANVWAIHMDPSRYPNPTAFDPSRFMGKDKPTTWSSGQDAQDRDQLSFHLACSIVFLELNLPSAISLAGADASVKGVTLQKPPCSSSSLASSGVSICKLPSTRKLGNLSYPIFKTKKEHSQRDS
jgi:Cytochrome P450